MINLLPSAYKKNLRREYFLRIFAVLLVLLGCSGIIALIFIAPAYVNATLKEQVLTSQLATLKQSQVITTHDSLNQVIQDINKKLKVFPDPNKNNALSKTPIEPLVSNTIPGITINQIGYAQDSNTMSVTIAGHAKDRETLLAFQKVLQAQPQFKNVTLPISNFIKESNLEFSIVFSII